MSTGIENCRVLGTESGSGPEAQSSTLAARASGPSLECSAFKAKTLITTRNRMEINRLHRKRESYTGQ